MIKPRERYRNDFKKRVFKNSTQKMTYRHGFKRKLKNEICATSFETMRRFFKKILENSIQKKCFENVPKILEKSIQNKKTSKYVLHVLKPCEDFLKKQKNPPRRNVLKNSKDVLHLLKMFQKYSENQDAINRSCPLFKKLIMVFQNLSRIILIMLNFSRSQAKFSYYLKIWLDKL